MNQQEKHLFQIPNYQRPEANQALSNNQKNQNSTKISKKQIENEHIFRDLLHKSGEISQARDEAKEFLRKRGLNA